MTRRHIDDLVVMGTNAFRPSGGELPDRAKGINIPTLNQFAVAVAPEGLPGVIGFLQSWILRSKTRTLKIKTPGGFEIEFPTDQKYTEDQFLALVDKLRVRK